MKNIHPDLLLIDPPITSSMRFGKLATAGSFLPSLALVSLGTFIQKAGYEVQIIDANLQGLGTKELAAKIITKRPKWLGITATTLTIGTVNEIAELVKRSDSEIIIIIGGAHMTAVPEQTIKKFKSFDIGVIGEGEITLIELVKVLEKRGDLSGVKGIVWRKNGRIIVNQRRGYISNLDDLPLPNWDLLKGFPRRYKPSANSYSQLPAVHLVTSRGCTGQCTFCDRSVFGRIPRMYSAKRVLAMIKVLELKYGIREIQFFDDNFALFPKRLETICRSLIRNKRKISWSCQTRADMVNPTALKMMKQAGCWQIGLGVESGCDRILKILKKQETKEMMGKAIGLIAKEGIEIKGFFILGNPGESEESLKETRDFILSQPLTYVHTTYFTPYPGSEIFKKASRYGKLLLKDWSDIGQGTIEAIFIPKGLTKEILNSFAKDIFRRFYFRPQIIYYHLRKIIFRPNLWSGYLSGLVSVLNFTKNEDRQHDY